MKSARLFGGSATGHVEPNGNEQADGYRDRSGLAFGPVSPERDGEQYE